MEPIPAIRNVSTKTAVAPWGLQRADLDKAHPKRVNVCGDGVCLALDTGGQQQQQPQRNRGR